ncbi:hypothetical protein RA2_03600 [Roseovarius sp. A-2]|uniref:hypothetical protein n=1 Tax=Roseovarius sp. A-2 TaxID=1570360 RepID=UPI0009B589F4|nr:hypothetical protein [Roseovarius sp. A-2]GAW36529.1 hypothetical protein RA2_03600 [Roseovarius sp. A-2]
MGQLRKIARELSKRARNGDRGAAQELLRHSIDLGHRRLALHRFFLATAMGVEPPPEHLRYCAELLGSIPEDAVRDIARKEVRNAQVYLARGSNREVVNV